MVKVSCSADAERIFRSVWSTDLNYRESFYSLYLNRANKVQGYQLISLGGTTEVLVDVRLIMQAALKALASSILLIIIPPAMVIPVILM